MTLSRRQLAIGAAALAAGLGVYLLTRDRALPPEEAVNKVLDDAVAAVQDGRVKDLMELVSERYQSEGEGAADRAELRSYLTALLFRGGVEVKVLSRTITLEDESRAILEATVVLVRGGFRGVAEGDVGARQLELHLEREGGDWKVVSSRQQRALE
jgi:hypothetical protein